MMTAIRRHYRRVAQASRPPRAGSPLPARVHAGRPVAQLHTADAAGAGLRPRHPPTTLTAVTAEVDPAETTALMREWEERDMPVPSSCSSRPTASITRALLAYVDQRRREAARTT